MDYSIPADFQNPISPIVLTIILEAIRLLTIFFLFKGRNDSKIMKFAFVYETCVFAVGLVSSFVDTLRNFFNATNILGYLGIVVFILVCKEAFGTVKSQWAKKAFYCYIASYTVAVIVIMIGVIAILKTPPL